MRRGVRKARSGERQATSLTNDETNPQIINLRCYTVVAGEPDVVTSEVREARRAGSRRLT